MRQDQRAPFVNALEQARLRAYEAGQFVDQESFMVAAEILELARQADISQASRVLDLCCGVAGPGRHIVRNFGCHYLGLDYSRSALEIARQRADREGLMCHFEEARIPPLPDQLRKQSFDRVLLLETLLAFADKPQLLAEIGQVLGPAGRLALTLEEGKLLSRAEQLAMPDSDTVWLTPLDDLKRMLQQAGFRMLWEQDWTRSHQQLVGRLLQAFESDAVAIEAQIGSQALNELLQAHRLWEKWLSCGRVRKFALVASWHPRNSPELSARRSA